MVFRRAGTAWDGQKWRLAYSLDDFCDQMEVIRPGTFPYDGTVASQGHDANNPDSDHTVWPKSGSGVVYAVDVDETYNTFIDEVWDAIRLSKDSRVKYGIHNKQMFSNYGKTSGGKYYPPFTWRPYSGYNDHIGHGHLSVIHGTVGDKRGSWSLGKTSTQLGGHVMLPLLDGDGLTRGRPEKQEDVRNLQYLLGFRGETDLDGKYGGDTAAAVKPFSGGDGKIVNGETFGKIQTAALKGAAMVSHDHPLIGRTDKN